jgi:hypothetical protein
MFFGGIVATSLRCAASLRHVIERPLHSIKLAFPKQLPRLTTFFHVVGKR